MEKVTSRYSVIMSDLAAGVKSVKEIAKEHKTTAQVIQVYDNVRQGKVSRGHVMPVAESRRARGENKGLAQYSAEDIIRMYENGYSTRKIARTLHIAERRVSWALYKADVKIRNGHRIHIPDDELMEEAVSLYKAGVGISRISQTTHINMFLIREAIIERGLYKDPHEPKAISDEQWREVADMYVGGMNLHDVSIHLHVGQEKVSAKLREMGVKMRNNGKKRKEAGGTD